MYYNFLLYCSLVGEGWNQLTACLNFGIINRPKKNLNSTQFIQGFRSRLNLCLLITSQSSSLSPRSSPCLSSGNYSRRPFQKAIEGFDCEINCQALGVELQHSLGGLDGQKHKHRVFPSWRKLLRAATSSLEVKVLPIFILT